MHGRSRPASRVVRRVGPVLVLAGVLAQLGIGGVLAAPSPGLLPVCVVPVARPDSTSVVHGRLKTVPAPGVLGNDVDIVGSVSTARLVTDVRYGSLTLDADGGYRYRSEPDFVGTDTFTYQVDGCVLGLSNVATVTITVTNAAPAASGDTYSAQAGVARTVKAPGILGNDSDPDGDAITATLVSGPANGSLSLNANGGFTYTADGGFSGTDTFRYRATDGIANSGTATVQITVSGPTPTPAPTPTPTPTPIIAIPSVLPSLPLPSGSGGLPTVPGASATPSPSPTAGGSGGPGATATPSPGPSGGTGQGGPGQGGVVPPPGGSGGSGGPGPGASPGPGNGPFTVGTTEVEPEIELEPGSFALASFDWAVPVLTLTVPGLFLIIAIVAQMTIGIAWIPVARRSLEMERRRRRTYVRAG